MNDQLEEWIQEGEVLADAIENARFGLLIAAAFRLGRWWADRPWRIK